MNRVSGAHQVDEPAPFYGGIIADPMGFGKTLTMIALAATDLELGKAAEPCVAESDKPQVSATLIIIPPPCEFECSYLSCLSWAFGLTEPPYLSDRDLGGAAVRVRTLSSQELF